MGTAALLPFTFIIDSVVLPGPAILTGLTGYHLYHASKAASGSQRLKRFVEHEEGTSDHIDLSIDDMDFLSEPRLERFYGEDAVELRDVHGVLTEQGIRELCEAMGQPLGMEDVLQQLRRRHLRGLGRL